MPMAGVAAAHKIQPAFLSYLEPLLSDGKVRELDVRELNRMLKDLTYTASMGLLNGTGLPLSAHGQVIGVIFIFRNYADVFTANDRVLLQSFADQAAVAVFNARLYGQINYEKQRLDALLDSAADGILILNADHTVERCNAAFERLYGSTREEIVGQPHAQIVRWVPSPQGTTLDEAEAQGWGVAPQSRCTEGDLTLCRLRCQSASPTRRCSPKMAVAQHSRHRARHYALPRRRDQIHFISSSATRCTPGAHQGYASTPPG
jgi:GAF domain-containing protein